MNKKEFLEIINDYLKGHFSEDEISDIVRDYEEFFLNGELQGKTEEEIIDSLGSPKTIANDLIVEMTGGKNEKYVSSHTTLKFLDLSMFKNSNSLNFIKAVIIRFITIITIPLALVVCAGIAGASIALIAGSIAALTSMVSSMFLITKEAYIGIFILFLTLISIGILIALWTIYIKLVIFIKNVFPFYISFVKKSLICTTTKRKKETSVAKGV